MIGEISSLIEKLGIYGAILIVLFGAVVWALAHFQAAPGTSVKIVWGLAEYNKRSSSSSIVEKRRSPLNKISGPRKTQGIVVHYNLNSSNIDELLK